MTDVIDNLLRYGSLALNFGILLLMMIRMMRRIRRDAAALSALYLALAAASLLLSDVYWIAHLLLRHGDRIVPYAVNEISESGAFLLFGAALRAVFPGRPKRVGALAAAAAVYVAVCAGLWIGWSGEWLKDIIGAIPFGYFIYMVLRAQSVTDALRKREWRTLGALTALLLCGEIAIFFLPAAAAAALDAFCYVLIFAVILWLLARNAYALRPGADARRMLSLAFILEAWSISSMYMCAEPLYFLAELSSTVGFAMILIAAERLVPER